MSVIKNLKFELDKFKIDIPHLEIADQGVSAIVGASGSGKSTFFKILLGLYQPQNWIWQFGDINIASLDIEKRNLGVVFQSYELFPHLTAEMNIKIVMKARKNMSHESLDRLQYFKTKLNLVKCWDTPAHKLSGGEQQRVALLRAVMSRSRMILLDEPFSALDQNLKQEAYKIVKELLDESQTPALIITHDLQEASLFSERLIHFDNGHIV